MPLAKVYPLYLAKLDRKGRTEAELIQAISWLTGFTSSQIQQLVDDGTTFDEFFEKATLNPMAAEIKGKICGVQIEEIADPLMKKIRYLDKLVDDLAKGKKLDKVLPS